MGYLIFVGIAISKMGKCSRLVGIPFSKNTLLRWRTSWIRLTNIKAHRLRQRHSFATLWTFHLLHVDHKSIKDSRNQKIVIPWRLLNDNFTSIGAFCDPFTPTSSLWTRIIKICTEHIVLNIMIWMQLLMLQMILILFDPYVLFRLSNSLSLNLFHFLLLLFLFVGFLLF